LLGCRLRAAQIRQRLQNRFFKTTNEEIVSMRDAIARALVCSTAPDGSKVAV